MNKTLTRLLVIGLLIGAGVWLAVRAAAPAAESTARLDALAALAPGRPLGGPAADAPAPMAGVATPVTVELSAVPTGVSTDNGLYAQWLRGEVDLTENESIVPEVEVAARQAQSLALPASPALESAAAALSPDAPTLGDGWASLDFTDSGGWTPPDPELAAGDNHLIAVVNSAFAVYNKSGTRLSGPTDIATFMGANANCRDYFAFDPNIIYDEAADRFIMGIDSAGIYYCLAVSATANPLGAWNIYAFRVGTSAQFFDYPHAGVGNSHIFAGANIFTSTFLESRVYAFDKAAMYAGSAAGWQAKSLPTTEDTPIPLHLHGFDQGTWNTGADHYFITDYNYDGANYRIWRWRNPLSGGNPAAVGVVNLQSYTGVTAGYPINATQKGSSARIQANDYRPHDFEYRNGFGWTTQTIACNPGGGTVNCVRWAKINPVTATIADAGVFASNGDHRIFPNIAANHCGDMAIGYTKTSTSIFPSSVVNGRRSGDPAGTLQAEAVAQAGTIAYTAFDGSPHRWGDYTGMTIDPDGLTFWYLGQYSKNTGDSSGRWATAIRALSYPDCDSPVSGVSVDLSGKGNGSAGGLAYQSADIIHYDGTSGQWSMVFDASDVGITKNTTAFYRQDRSGAPDILFLSFAASQNIPGVGTVAPHDVVRFTPTQLGDTTAGTFDLYIDGSDVGLSATGERIDALGMTGNQLLISTVGSGSVPRGGGMLAFADEDVIAFTPTMTGNNTAGTWAAFFDGSAAVAGLGAEDVTGFYDDPAGNDLYISLANAFNLGGVSGNGKHILRLSPAGGGTYTPFMVWDGQLVNYGSVIDAFEITP